MSKPIYFLKLDFVVTATVEHGLSTRAHEAGKVMSQISHVPIGLWAYFHMGCLSPIAKTSRSPFLHHCLRLGSAPSSSGTWLQAQTNLK